GLILGITAVLSPVLVQKALLRRELPLLLAITAVFTALLVDGDVSRLDAWILMGVFTVSMGFSILSAMKDSRNTNAESAVADDDVVIVDGNPIALSRRAALLWLALGLILLTASSRLLVYGAVALANAFGVSDVIIGLTVVAVGTS